MEIADIIRKKRDGNPLTREEIRFALDNYVAGRIPDYQISALLMAIWFRGMNVEETAEMTFAIRDSGERLDFSGIPGIRADKHSTGGVGDKTSLVVAPVAASLGLKVAKMSGRGLGHTGGTVDKLESIEGFRTDLSPQEFAEIVNRVGVCIVGQSRNMAPADKLLYALRDVTATVDSLPLIVSSIMGKKLAADDHCIVLDVKTGSGAFMKTLEDSRKLAESMVEIGKRAGKRMAALITDMNRPLGNAVGNALEVVEAIETLRGYGPADLRALCTELAATMLYLAEKDDMEDCRRAVQKVLTDGTALQTFADMVAAQGGNRNWILHPENFPKAACTKTVVAPASGYITAVNAEDYGRASLTLGAGRRSMEDVIDPTAGLLLHVRRGEYAEKGAPLATLYTNRPETLAEAESILLNATRFANIQPSPEPLILERIY